MILLDTHCVAWFHLAEEKLGRSARTTIANALSDKKLLVCTLSYFELGRKVLRGQIKGLSSIESFRSALISSGVREITPDGASVVRSVDFINALPDAMDALFLAIADVHNLTLITADERILAWKGRVKRIDARK